MTNIQKAAQKHAKSIGWALEDAREYAIALLTECNAHAEVDAIRSIAIPDPDADKAQEWAADEGERLGLTR